MFILSLCSIFIGFFFNVIFCNSNFFFFESFFIFPFHFGDLDIEIIPIFLKVLPFFFIFFSLFLGYIFIESFSFILILYLFIIIFLIFFHQRVFLIFIIIQFLKIYMLLVI